MSELEILSRIIPGQKKKLRQYFVDGINTIGVWGKEPCAIQVRNPSHQMIQVKISIDGTDILTGEIAQKEPKGPMFIIDPFKYMERNTWPESHHGGAQFVFAPLAQSVAAHTHGDLTARGYISCAIFKEGHVPPSPRWIAPDFTRYAKSGGGGQSLDRGEYRAMAIADPGPAMGAGDYEQEYISQGKGLIKPIFSHIVQVRYLWWDDLEDRLHAQGIPTTEHPTGFHGSIGINLGSTPRPPVQHPSSYSRFA